MVSKRYIQFFRRYPDSTHPGDEILQLLELRMISYLTTNITYSIGTAMGQRFAPSYMNIYMSEWEEEVTVWLFLLPLAPQLILTHPSHRLHDDVHRNITQTLFFGLCLALVWDPGLPLCGLVLFHHTIWAVEKKKTVCPLFSHGWHRTRFSSLGNCCFSTPLPFPWTSQ